MFNHPPFLSRVVLLLSLMLVVSVVDLYRNGLKATRFREYGFILVTGLLGAVVGAANDFVTSSISPEYFIWGKGLSEGPALRIHATILGMQVGFSAGIIGGALCLFAGHRRRTQSSWNFYVLLQFLWMPVAGAILCGVLAPLALRGFDPLRFGRQLGTFLSADQLNRFRQVWWIHSGLYAGMILGLGAMIVSARKKMSQISPAQV